MVLRGRHIGWCLLAASSLFWLGCNQVPRAPDGPPGQLSKGPPTAPPLQIVNPPPQVANAGQAEIKTTEDIKPKTVGKASLLPPSSDRIEPVPQGQAVAEQKPMSPLRTLHRLAAERYAATPAYIAKFRRREAVDGTARPEELILFKYRREPQSIYMRWLGKEAKDRELLYVRGQYDDMIHVAPSQNDSGILSPSGRRTIVRPDSPQGLGKERYPVAETGIGGLIDRFGRLVDAVERGDAKVGMVKYLGKVKRPECDVDVDAVMHILPPGFDPGLPKGGQRLWYFDSVLRLPVLVIAHDAQGQEVEYYHFDRFSVPGRVPEDEFNPTNIGHH